MGHGVPRTLIARISAVAQDAVHAVLSFRPGDRLGHALPHYALVHAGDAAQAFHIAVEIIRRHGHPVVLSQHGVPTALHGPVDVQQHLSVLLLPTEGQGDNIGPVLPGQPQMNHRAAIQNPQHISPVRNFTILTAHNLPPPVEAVMPPSG